MRLFLFLLFSLLISVSADFLTEGFRFIDAERILSMLNRATSPGQRRNELLCQMTFCHSGNRRDCATLCEKSALKFDVTVKEVHLHPLVKLQPGADVEGCKTKCNTDCGKNDCSSECQLWCEVRESYKTKFEYENEIVLSLHVNVTLIALILKCSRKALGAYRYLLLTFATVDIYYGIVHFLVMPIPEAGGNAFYMGAHGYVAGKAAVAWFAATHSHSFVVLVFHFLYRLLAVQGSHYLRLFSKLWFFGVQLVCVAAVGVVWFSVIYYLYDVDYFVVEYMGPIMREHTIATRLPLEEYTVAVFWTNGTFAGPRWKPISGFTIMSLTMGGAYGLMMYAAYKIRWFMKKSSPSCKKTIALQKQLMLALMYQTILPLVTAYSPPLIAVASPFFGLSLSFMTNIATIFCGAHPWLDGCVIIWTIKEYRLTLLHWLRLKKRSVVPLEVVSSRVKT